MRLRTDGNATSGAPAAGTLANPVLGLFYDTDPGLGDLQPLDTAAGLSGILYIVAKIQNGAHFTDPVAADADWYWKAGAAPDASSPASADYVGTDATTAFQLLSGSGWNTQAADPKGGALTASDDLDGSHTITVDLDGTQVSATFTLDNPPIPDGLHLAYSTSADRSSPQILDGATITGQIAVFLVDALNGVLNPAPAGLDRVDFAWAPSAADASSNNTDDHCYRDAVSATYDLQGPDGTDAELWDTETHYPYLDTPNGTGTLAGVPTAHSAVLNGSNEIAARADHTGGGSTTVTASFTIDNALAAGTLIRALSFGYSGANLTAQPNEENYTSNRDINDAVESGYERVIAGLMYGDLGYDFGHVLGAPDANGNLSTHPTRDWRNIIQAFDRGSGSTTKTDGFCRMAKFYDNGDGAPNFEPLDSDGQTEFIVKLTGYGAGTYDLTIGYGDPSLTGKKNNVSANGVAALTNVTGLGSVTVSVTVAADELITLTFDDTAGVDGDCTALTYLEVRTT